MRNWNWPVSSRASRNSVAWRLPGSLAPRQEHHSGHCMRLSASRPIVRWVQTGNANANNCFVLCVIDSIYCNHLNIFLFCFASYRKSIRWIVPVSMRAKQLSPTNTSTMSFKCIDVAMEGSSWFLVMSLPIFEISNEHVGDRIATPTKRGNKYCIIHWSATLFHQVVINILLWINVRKLNSNVLILIIALNWITYM